MKLSSFNLLGLCILIIFLGLLQWQVRLLKTNQYYKMMYERVLVNAVEDATSQMRRSSKQYGHDLLLVQELNIEDIVNSFFSSLYYQLNARTPEKQEELKQLVPFVLVLDHDGYHINVYDRVQKGDDFVQARITLPKRPYAIFRDGVAYKLNLAGYIRAYSQAKREQPIAVGNFEDLVMLRDMPELSWLYTIENEFELVRIVFETIALELEMHISNHLKTMQADGLDGAIEFDLSKIYNDSNLLNAGVFAMVQGLKGAGSHTINLSAFTRMSIDKNHYVIAYRDNILKTYCKSSCSRYENLYIQQVFNNAKEAAEQGYFPCEICYSISD
jgi:hypothetical protein